MELNILLESLNFTKILLGAIGSWQIALIVLAILLLFGGRKLPELAKGLGLGLREFKNASRDIKKEVEDAADDIKDSVEK